MLGVIGDVVQDVVVWTQEPVRHATDTAAQITMTRGGSAANVAAFAGPRHPTRFIGCVGDDLGGVALTRELESHGVDVRMQTAAVPTGTVVLLIDTQGERTMFPSRSASAQIAPVPDEWLAGVTMLHVTGYSLQSEPARGSVMDACRRVKTAGGRISFDVSSTGMIDLFGRTAFQDLMSELAPDVITANRDEAGYLHLAGEDGAGPFLRHLGDATLLARAGKAPTRIFRAGTLIDEVPVTPVEAVRDFTGAGDAFNAGYLAAVLSGADEHAACLAAHDLARVVLTCPGASEPASGPVSGI